MKDNTKHPTASREIYEGQETQVYTLESLIDSCKVHQIHPSRQNVRRMRRAIDLHKTGAVRPLAPPEVTTEDFLNHFHVRSQREEKFYSVFPRVGCSCPDAANLSEEFALGEEPREAALQRISSSNIRCKHEIAVLLFLEDARMKAEVEEYERRQVTENTNINDWDPEVDLPIDID